MNSEKSFYGHSIVKQLRDNRMTTDWKRYNKMEIEERHKLFHLIMWDYKIPPADIDAVLQGKKKHAGHYDRQSLVVKLLESYPWFTIIQLFSPKVLRQLITTEVIKKLRSGSLRTRYEYVQKRLQELVPDAE